MIYFGVETYVHVVVARREYQRLATSPAAVWHGNFRELSASIMRMATLAEEGKITLEVVKDEIDRLRHAWQPEPSQSPLDSLLSAQSLADLDLFDRLQLDAVIATCRSCATLAKPAGSYSPRHAPVGGR